MAVDPPPRRNWSATTAMRHSTHSLPDVCLSYYWLALHPNIPMTQRSGDISIENMQLLTGTFPRLAAVVLVLLK